MHEGRLQGLMLPVCILHVHASCAPGTDIGMLLPAIEISPDVLQSDALPEISHVTDPAPGSAQVGVPVIQVGVVPEQKALDFSVAPEISIEFVKRFFDIVQPNM